MRPSIAFAALTLLKEAGCEVVVPMTQSCCGQPNYNSGDRRSARKLAEKLLAEFEGFDYLVAPSGSCAGMIRTHYPDLFRDADPALRARVERLCAKTYELTDFLVNVAGLDHVPGTFNGTVTYHDSCSGLRELGVKAQPRKLLALVPGLRLAEMDECEQCCGFGGTFSLKNPDVSVAMGSDKARHAQETGAEVLCSADSSCLMHIGGLLSRQRSGMRVLHLAEILAATEGAQQ